MIREFGGELFDPDDVLCGRLVGDAPWVEVAKDGLIKRINLDAAGVAALRAWMAENDHAHQYDALMERLREQHHSTTSMVA